MGVLHRGRVLATVLALALALALGVGRGGAADRSAPAAAVPAAAVPADSATITLLLVRHAEKQPHPPGGDAGLSTKGLVRAQELARVARDAGVTGVYASQYGRAIRTAEPLARALGDSVRVYDANRSDLLAARLRAEGRGRTLLVVGHGDSVPELVEALTGARLLAGESVPYDRLFLLTLRPGAPPHLVRLRYGAAAD